MLELGPGTGAVTEALSNAACAKTGSSPSNAIPKWRKLLREKFPRAQIIIGDAWELDHLLRGSPRARRKRRRGHLQPAAAEFSKPEEAEALAQKIRNMLEPQGTWVQYSYHIHKIRSRGASSFQAARLQNRLVQFPTRPRQRFSEIIFFSRFADFLSNLELF